MNEIGRYSRQAMSRQGSRRLSLIFFLAVSATMLIFSLYGARASAFEKAREVVLDAFSPVLTWLSAPIGWADERIGDVGDYFNTLEQNKQLREENEELRAWMQEALTLRQQVAYFKDLLEVRAADEASFVDAQVIGESGGPYQRSLIVNAGTSDGIEVGDGVIGTSGLVGHIVTAGSSSSRVLMLTDFNNRTPVFIEGAEVEAILAGRYQDDPELKFLATRDRALIGPGMRVITSGTGGRLPRGLAVGEIGAVGEDMITVRLFTKYNNTDFVRIVDYTFLQEEDVAGEAVGEGEAAVDDNSGQGDATGAEPGEATGAQPAGADADGQDATGQSTATAQPGPVTSAPVTAAPAEQPLQQAGAQDG